MLNRRELLMGAGAAVALPVFGQSGYPNKPIRIIVATVPGSGPDIAVRKMAPLLSDLLKQPVLVENKPGGNGIIAANELMKAPRDGYTLLDANIGNALNDILRPQAGPRMFEDLVPLTDLTAGALVLLVNADLPVKTAQEFIAYAKANPGALNYGSGGPGSLIQLTGEWLKIATGISMKEVPYRSLGADLVDLVAGHVQVGFTVWSLIEAQIKSGKVRPLAIASGHRISGAPDLPTFAEAGLTDIQATGWNGMFASAGTPPEVVQTVAKAIIASVRQPEYVQFFTKDGSDVGGKSPQEFSAFVKSEQDHYRQVVLKANIKVTD
jgi:tripartite-type tricarboxylate transporter receptor subunit TctC